MKKEFINSELKCDSNFTNEKCLKILRTDNNSLKAKTKGRRLKTIKFGIANREKILESQREYLRAIREKRLE